MTSISTCKFMNEIYEILKPLTVDQIREMERELGTKSNAQAPIALYCCNETIRRKKAGVWA